MDIMLFVGIIVLSLWGLSRMIKPQQNRCHMAGPGESKVHKWMLKSTSDSKVMELQCRVCGQRPGEE